MLNSEGYLNKKEEGFMEENQNVQQEQQPQVQAQPQQTEQQPQVQAQPQPPQQQYNQQQYNQQPGQQYNQQPGQQYGQPVQESRVAIGILCALFLGLIGLLIGYLIYKEKEYEWKTFLKGWMWTFFICLGIDVVLGILYFTVFASIFATMWSTGGGVYGFIGLL